MKHILVLFISILSLIVHGQSPMESAILSELNLARSAPAAYAAILQDFRLLVSPDGQIRLPDHDALPYSDGLASIDEAIAFLLVQQPLRPLSHSPVLSSLAESLLLVHQKTGTKGHILPDGTPTLVRASRYATFRTFGELIAYGDSTARAFIISLIIDAGVPSRGHRVTIFTPFITHAGVAFGSHPIYNSETVIEVSECEYSSQVRAGFALPLCSTLYT